MDEFLQKLLKIDLRTRSNICSFWDWSGSRFKYFFTLFNIPKQDIPRDACCSKRHHLYIL